MRPTSTPGGDAVPCPPWCRRRHRPGDHPDDLLHQSDPAFVALVHGAPPLTDDQGRADGVVLRLVQRVGATTVWLEAVSEEGRALHLLLSAESARRLADAVAGLLTRT